MCSSSLTEVMTIQGLCQTLVIAIIGFQQVQSQTPSGEGAYFTSCPDNIKAELYGEEINVNVSWFTPVASSSNGTELETMLIQDTTPPGSLFSVGEHSITYLAEDLGSDTMANCTFVVTVISSQSPSTTTCPNDDYRDVTDIKSEGTPIQIPNRPIFTDNSGMPLNITSNVPGDEGASYQFPIGVTAISYTATDEAGNQATCEYIVEVMLAPPSKVWNISIKDYNASCITLIWLHVRASQYDISYWVADDNSTGEKRMLTQFGDDSSVFVEKEICGLLPGTLYDFEVKPTSQDIDSFRIQQRTKPVAPNNLQEENIDSTSISISWTNSDLASFDQYHLYYHEVGKEDVLVDLGYVHKKMNSYTLSSLRPSVTYSIFVETVRASGESRTTNFATLTESTTDIPVNTLVVSNFTESTIRVVWSNQSTTNTILLFIQKTTNEMDTKFYPLFPGSSDFQPSYEFTDLEASTSYEIYFVINGNSALRTSVTQTTRPSRITDLQISNTLTSISLTWEGNAKSYECYISPNDGNLPIPILTNKEQVVFSDLKENTDYYVEVVSLKDEISSVSVTDIVRTDEIRNADDLEKQDFFLVIVVAGAAGILLLILLIIICGLLCMIPCEEDQPPPEIPEITYPNGNHQTQAGNRTSTDVTTVSMRMKNDPNGNQTEQAEEVEDPYHRIGTYRNMFGRRVKPRGYSLHKRKYDAGEQQDSDIYENVASEPEAPRYPRPSSNPGYADMNTSYQGTEMNQAISRSFEALNEDYPHPMADNNQFGINNTTM